jgi:hypothetical protein
MATPVSFTYAAALMEAALVETSLKADSSGGTEEKEKILKLIAEKRIVLGFLLKTSGQK